jgi:hypothetical protein
MTKSGQLYSRNLVVGSITDTSHCRPLGSGQGILSVILAEVTAPILDSTCPALPAQHVDPGDWFALDHS